MREVRGAYTPREEGRVEKLRRLDAKVRRPADIFAYTFGITMVAANYFLYRAILRARKKKYAKEVIDLTDDLLNEKK